MHLNINNNLNFAGETMPIDGKYALNIERFDREVALLEINEAQFIMIYKRRNLIMPTIEKALKKTGGVKKHAARLLGITFRSMRYRLEKYGME